MKIHYTADKWQGGFYLFFSKALKKLGHEVVFFNSSGTTRQYMYVKFVGRIPKMHYPAQTHFREEVTRDWLKSVEAARPDLVIIDFAPCILPSAIEKVKKSGVKIFYWLTSPAWGANSNDMLLGLRHADRIFTIDRVWSPTVLFGFKPYTFLPLAGDPESFYPIDDLRRTKLYDAVYLGSMPPQAGDGVTRAYLMASIPSKHRVAVFGHGAKEWVSDFPVLKERIHEISGLPTEEVNKIYNQSRTMMNIHSVFHVSSLSARTYEIGLSGAFQLLEYREDLDRLFPKGLIPSFTSPSEMNALLDQWLAKDKERDARAKEIRAHVLAHHTWEHRAKEMLGYL